MLFTRRFIRQTQQNYLTKTDLDGSVFLCKNPFFMSVQVVVVIPLGIITTWTDPYGHKDRIFMEKYGAVQVYFGKLVLLWNDWKLVMTCDTVDFFRSINHSCTASISLQHWHSIPRGIGTHLEQLHQSNFPKHFMKKNLLVLTHQFLIHPSHYLHHYNTQHLLVQTDTVQFQCLKCFCHYQQFIFWNQWCHECKNCNISWHTCFVALMLYNSVRKSSEAISFDEYMYFSVFF